MMFWATDMRARRREVVKGAAERARAKMMDMRAIARATGSGRGEIVEGLPRRDHEWEDDDETLQTHNYTGTRGDVVAYCYPFDPNIPVGSIDPLPRSGCGIVTRTGSDSVKYGIGSTEKVNISQTRLEEAFSIPFSLDQSLTTRHYPTTPRLAPHVLFHTFVASLLGLFL